MLHAELLAVKFGLELALNRRFMNILLESDSLMAIKELEKGLGSSCEWGVLVNDIVGLKELFHSCTMSHIGRLVNNFAHILAKFFKESEDYRCWVGCASVCVIILI